MIKSRKGIISLPIRLMLSFVIISLMVPPVMSMVGSIQEDMEAQELSLIAEDLRKEVDRVGSRNPGFVSVMELYVPSGGHLSIGGDKGTIIRLFVDDGQVGRVIADHPIVTEETLLYGDVLLEIRCVEGGVEVREI